MEARRMNRMSAKYIGQALSMTTKEVYEMWNDMGLVSKDKFGDWILTELGKEIGGEMSKNNYISVPTFELEKIEQLMVDFYKSHS